MSLSAHPILRSATHAYYNTGVVSLSDRVYLIGRSVNRETTDEETQIDSGTIQVWTTTGRTTVAFAELKLHCPGVINWEDPRCYPLSEDEALVGLTALGRISGQTITHPALWWLRFTSGGIQVTKVKVLTGLRGKNCTPISPRSFLVRLEGEDHRLRRYTLAGRRLKLLSTTHFPKDIPWLSYRVGTTAAPMRLEGLLLLPIHGIERLDGRYVYRIGLAVCDERWRLLGVDPKPLFSRTDFRRVLPSRAELHRIREVIYCCGYRLSKEAVQFYLNLGDLMTVEATVPLETLRRRMVKLTSQSSQGGRGGLKGQ